MGMFTWVHPAPELLPEEYRHLEGWQTKDVVEPLLETLIITSGGRLLHQELGKEHPQDTFYHGDMAFYTFNGDANLPDTKFVSLEARFTEGQLVGIKEV